MSLDLMNTAVAEPPSTAAAEGLQADVVDLNAAHATKKLISILN
jgi:hypothetical protein